MNKNQLFYKIKGIDLPECAFFDQFFHKYVVRRKIMPAAFAVFWPDNGPCPLVEIYLLFKSSSLTVRELDGGSLKVVISDLTHLIRFCWIAKINLWEVDDISFTQFVRELCERNEEYDQGKRKRNYNTAQRIIDNCIKFFEWLQKYIFPERLIVGKRSEFPQISLIEKTYTNQNGIAIKKLVPSYGPPKDTPDPKGPMPRHISICLWDAVSEMANPALKSERYARRFSNQTLLNNELNYLRARRELMLLLLEATGCRPGELARLKVSENDNSVKKRKLVLVTLKRRKDNDPLRIIPIEGSISIKLEVFIYKYRERMLQDLKANRKKTAPENMVFLTIKGTPLSEKSMTKDFQRIVKMADINERTCMTMFRHRFITNMVKLHLKAFMDEEKKVKHLLSESDYRTILKRVRVFTGHGSEKSLMGYIDWAWEEMDLFSFVQPAYELMTEFEGCLNNLNMIKARVRLEASLKKEDLMNLVIDEIDTSIKNLNKTIGRQKTKN